MGKATVIKVDGSETPLDKRPTLTEAQEIVGGYIEFVRTKGGTLVVDDEGRLKGKTLNNTASAMYGGIIVGDVILLEGWQTVG